MKLFIALLFEDNIKDQIYDWLEEVEAVSVSGNFSNYDNLHLTIIYLGDTNPDMYQVIKTKLQEIVIQRFSYQTTEIDCFKKNKPKKIVYLGVKHSDPLKRLYNQVVLKLRELDLVIPTNRYTPHITLGRQVALISTDDLTKVRVKPLIIQANRISMMESTRIDGELTYIERDSIPLN